jgi:1,4-alpha-glucan branching enzyme
MGEEFLEDKIWSDNSSFNGLIYWAGLTTADTTMKDFLQFMTDLLKLRSSQAALRGPSARVSRCQNFDRVLVLHRRLEGIGGDIVVVASVDELPKYGYAIGLPYAGTWRELFNSDYYYQFPNAAVIGNGGSVQAAGGPLDGFASSATMTIPGNGVIVLGR